MEGRDTESFGTLKEYYQGSRLFRFLVAKFAPGSGHWLSWFYPFLFFTIQAQAVLWMLSRRMPGFQRLQHRRAAFDSVLMITFWLGLCIAINLRASLFVVVVPMLTANFVIMSYIITNHTLRPMIDNQDVLSTTISVATLRVMDILHFNFSHHVEHHLFPGVPSSSYPLIRHGLHRLAPDYYLCPPHWWAFLVTYRTPRFYEDTQTLIEPNSSRRVKIVDVETMLTEMLS
jgi:fatty acid desaturase